MSPRLLTSWLPRSKKSARRSTARLGIEYLEDRTMPSTGLPPDVVVGRTLSTYTVAGVQDDRLDVTYTVYNETADDITGVLLTTTLQPGVTVATASAMPDRSGQNLAWSLGTVPGFGRASVTLTVTLPDTPPLQIDSGAHVFGTLNAGTVTDAAPAAALVNRVIAPELLASTPDANTTDPFVQEQAAKLDYDPQRIFDFLNTEVGYESYVGSLRGARGTLWSAAGNSLDEASLGVALFRASGIPARYAHGTLSDPLSKQLILSMFPPSFQTVGFVPAGTPVADPANDTQLLTETRDHYWLQFDSTGGGFVNADTSGLPGGAIGTAFTTATNTFTEVADGLRHKVRVTLDAETYSQAAGQLGLGDGLGTTAVLDHTFNAADLVGRPATVGQFVNQSAVGGVTFSTRTTTYSPYLALGDAAYPDQERDTVIRGQDFQEVLTNLPLGNQILTGLFLTMTLSGPGGAPVSYDRTLFDRIGYAARQGVAGTEVAVDPNGPPALTDFDVTTINALPGLQNPTVAVPQLAYLEQLRQTLARFQNPDGTLQLQGLPLLRAYYVGLSRLAGTVLLSTSDASTAEGAATMGVRAYFDLPRLVLTGTSLTRKADGQTEVRLTIDLRRDTIRVVLTPGQNTSVARAFNAIRGQAEAALESAVAAKFGEALGGPGAVNRSADAVFQAAVAQQISLVTVSAASLAVLDGLAISAEAKARITRAVEDGWSVIVPTASVLVGGTPSVAWYQVHPESGETIAVGEDGLHEGVAGWVVGLGVVVGLLIIFAPGPLSALAGIVGIGGGSLVSFTFGGGGPALFPLIGGVLIGLVIGAVLKWIGSFFHDPPLAPVLTDPIPPEAIANQARVVRTVAAGPPAGSVTGPAGTQSLTASGQLSASWSAAGVTGLLADTITASSATVQDAGGNPVGTGAVGLTAGGPAATAVSGNVSYQVAGDGLLSFYAEADPGLGVGGNWTGYTATTTGDVRITLTTGRLTLNGQTLPAGTYTIVTSSAALTGRGPTTSPTFAGSASIAVTGGAVRLGRGSGSVTVGGAALPLDRGATLAGYTGTVTVAAGGAGSAPDGITLNGTTAGVLSVSIPGTSLTTDQNTPVSFQPAVSTSLADSYTLTVEAPARWAVAVDASGVVTVTPAPGLQGGTFPVRVVARSSANPNLVAQATAIITVTPAASGVTLSVQPDSLVTVPYLGAEIPSAFRAVIHNTGPTADTFTLSGSNIPAGFTLLTSVPSVTIPAGETGIIGVYLQPNGTQLPAPGTPASFTVTATSTTSPAIAATNAVNLTMPEVHGVTLIASPSVIATTPGGPVTTALTLRNVGNVAENVTFTTVLPAGWTAGGLNPLSLVAGATTTVMVTLTPAATAALNSRSEAIITARFGTASAPVATDVPITVLVRSAQTLAIGQASAAAEAADNAALGVTLSALGDIIAGLQTAPADAALLARVKFLLDKLDTLLRADPSLAPFVASLQPLRAAADAGDTAGLLALVPGYFGPLTAALTTLAREQYTVAVTPGSVDLQPGQGKTFTVALTNTGADPLTLNLSAAGLPAGVNVGFTQTQVMLAPGAATTVTATLTQTITSTALFTLDVTAAATVARRIATAAVAVRPAVADVLGVTLTPVAVTAGTPVAVVARVFNTANAIRTVVVHVDVLNSVGVVVGSLADQTVMLEPRADAVTLNLGPASTTGLPDGAYRVRVTLRTTDGAAIPGRSAEQFFLVGVPITATVGASATNLPPGTTPVTTTITVTNQTNLVTVPGGKLFVANDEWTLSDTGFNVAPADAAQFIRNLTGYFTGGGPGSFLVYSNNFSLTQPRLAAAMMEAGNTWTVSTTVPFDVSSLMAYDAVFVGGFPADTQVLTDYVLAGGNVYLLAGTGLLGAFGNNAAEAAFWNPFLVNFDLTYSPSNNGVSGVIALTSTHPALAGVAGLYQDLGQSILSIGPNGKIISQVGGRGLYAVYDGQANPIGPPIAPPPDNPPAPGDQVVWTGGASGSWTVAANWLDVDDNVNRLPTANDDVVIDVPGGATVTLDQSQQTMRSIRVAVGNTLVLSRAVLTLRADSQIDGSLMVDTSQLKLGRNLTLNGPSQWVNTFGLNSIALNGRTLTNTGTMTIGTAAGGDFRLVADTGFSGGTLRNTGTIVQHGGTLVTLANDTGVTNAAGATYELTGDGSLTRVNSFSPVVNAGTLHKSGGTGTSLVGNDLVFSNTGGTIRVDSGRLTVGANAGASTGGMFEVAPGATLDLSGLRSGATFAGTYTGTGGGSVLLGNAATLTIGAGGATFDFPAGMFTWDNATINLRGHTLTNAGMITLGTTGTAILQSRDIVGALAAHGTLLNTGTFVHPTIQFNLSDAATFTNQGDYQFTGNGRVISASGPLVAQFNNIGTLTASPAGVADFFTNVNNLGTMTAQSGTLRFAFFLNNTGTVVADGAIVTADNLGNTLRTGRWVAQSGGTVTFTTNVTTNGANLFIDGVGSQITGLQNLAVNTGTLTVTNGAILNTNVNLTNRGTITIGPAGRVNITGQYIQEAAGTLAVQLGGAPAGGQFGQLVATQSTTLGGALRAELAGGYVPTAGDSFGVVTSVGSSGAFGGTVLPATGTVGFGATVSANSVMLTAQASAATPTTTTVTSTLPGGATFGQLITFTATVQAASGTPTGSVQFQLDGVSVGAPVPLVGGSASFPTVLTTGQHTVAALYFDDSAQFAGSDNTGSPLVQTVNPRATTPIGNVTLYYSQAGGTGGLSQITATATGTSFTLGPPTAVVRNVDTDGLLFLPNGTLLLGGDTIRQLDPATRAVVGPVINTPVDHLALDPSRTKAWASRERGALIEIPLNPFGTVVTHAVTGDDNGVTQLAFDAAGNAYYTVAGNFGTIDLTTFTTQRIVGGLATEQALTFDPYTGHLILVGGGGIAQFDPVAGRFVSVLGPGGNLDHVSADGKGHLLVTDNNGHLLFIDYSATGLVGDPRTFVATAFLANALDDAEFVLGTGTAALSVTVSHDLPMSGYPVDPGSLVPAGTLTPSSVVWLGQFPAGSTDPLSFVLTGQATGLAPGEVRLISDGTTLTAVLVAPNGSLLPVTLQLPPVVVSADHVVALTPAEQTTGRNASATFTVRVSNPLPTAQTYMLSVEGLDGMTITLPASVIVPAGQAVDVTLRVDVSAGVAAGVEVFRVVVRTAAGGEDSAEGRLTVTGDLAVPSLAVAVTLSPSQAAAGQGTTAVYLLTITNVGEVTDTYVVSGSFPAGVTAVFSQTTVTVPAGVGNSRTIMLTLTPAIGTAPGDLSFTVRADSTVSATAVGTLTVLGGGVSVTLDPPAGPPGTALQFTVTNTGAVADTFDLTVAGPAGLVATLGVTQLTLGPGQSQVVPITTTAADFAAQGALGLVAAATSRTNAAIRDAAEAALQIAPTAGLAAHFEPASKTLPTAGTTDFLLLVDNIGNTEDAFTATITSTTGPVTAVLIGPDGLPTQTIATFRLPGLSSGAILVLVSITAGGEGTVTVQIRSLTDSSRTVTTTATIAVPVPAPQPPTAVSQSVITDASVPVVITLGGVDPNTPPLPLTFRVTVAPAHGTLGPVTGNTVTYTPAAGYAGPDSFQFVVNNGSADSLPAVVSLTVSAPAAPLPPTASPQAVTTDAGTPVTITLGGTDPNTPARPLTFRVITAPAHGTLGPVVGNTVTYTPAPGYSGPDSFEFVVNNGAADSAPATVSVAVRPPAPVLVGFREFGVGAGAGHPAVARFFNPDGSERFSRDVFPGLSGGVRVTSADFTGDGVAELVAGTGPGSITRVVVLDGNTGAELFSIQPFEDRFIGGVFVAAGDLTGDGVPDLVISPDESGGPRVRVFSGVGFVQLADFFGIDDPDFRGGARPAIGDVNGDGVGDLIISAGFGGGPRVSVIDGRSLAERQPRSLVHDFFIFEETLRNGAYVAVGDLDGDGFAEVIGGGGPGGGPRVLALSGRDLMSLPPDQAGAVANFFGGDEENRGGIRLVARNLDGDRLADLVVGDGAGAGSRVTGYLGKNVTPSATPPEHFAFDVYPGFDGGVFVG